MNFNEMAIGGEAVVDGFFKQAEQYRQKLLAMGLTRGTKITLLKRAPLGDPVEIMVRGFRLSLRKGEADVLVLKGVDDE
jgi:ferrous iron transport protein A